MDVLSPIFQLALAGFMAELQQKLKDSRHPALTWLNDRSALMNKAVSALLAIGATIGITAACVVDPATGLGTCTQAGIPFTLAAWGKVAILAFSQYWAQKGWYRLLIRQPEAMGLRS